MTVVMRIRTKHLRYMYDVKWAVVWAAGAGHGGGT